MHFLRVAAAIAVFVCCSTLALAQAGSGDVFSTNTGEGGKPLTGTAQDYGCFDQTWRQARNALHSWQISEAPNWKDPPSCQKGADTSGGDLGSCWGSLHSAQSLIEQATQLFKTARRTPEPQSRSINAQANELLKQAAGLIDQAWGCYTPKYRAYVARTPPPSRTPPQGPVASNNPPPQGQQPQQRPPQNSQRGNSPNPAQSPEDCDRELQSTGNEALDTMRGMGQQADRILTAFGNTIRSATAQLLQPDAFVQKQIQNVAVMRRFLEQDNRTFTIQAWQGMLKTLEEVKKDPATAIGTATADWLLGRVAATATGATGRVAWGAACNANARLKIGLQRMKDLKKIRENQPKGPIGSGKDLGNKPAGGKPSGEKPPGEKPAGEEPAGTPPTVSSRCSSLNPSEWNYACVQRSVAADMREETGHAWTTDNFKWTVGDVATLPEEARELLKAIYGDRRFRTQSAAETLAQANGDWIPTTLEEIPQKLKAAGSGSRALVLTQKDMPGDQIAHAFNAEYSNGTMHYFDADHAPGGIRVLQVVTETVNPTFKLSFWYYRTAGPDMVK